MVIVISLYKYIEACDRFELELRECLTKKEIDDLRNDYAVSGVDGFYAWVNNTLKTIRLYVQSTPSQRQKKKAWQASDIRRRLVLGSIWYVKRARQLLEIIEKHYLVPGDSYRDTAGRAGQAYIDLVYKRPKPWPFDDPDPFGDES